LLSGINIIKILIINYLSKTKKYFRHCLSLLKNADLYYVVESSWVVLWNGMRITQSLNDQKLIKASIAESTKLFRSKIIHFGSRPALSTIAGKLNLPHPSCKNILTWYHINPDYTPKPDIKQINSIIDNIDRFDIIHTACSKTYDELISHGFPREKLVVIPLGVDTKYFKPYKIKDKEKIRESLGIPKDSICIGSFQKDGIGWGIGDDPKLVKGPDIFCKSLEKIALNNNIFCLLVGPARGYVKNNLLELGIPFIHKYSDKKYMPEIELPDYYNALDLYLVTSRVEGGPLALVEAMACGIPLITTDVGMARDIIINGENGFILHDFDNIEEDIVDIFENKFKKIDRTLYERSSVKFASRLDTKIISSEFYNKIYSRI